MYSHRTYNTIWISPEPEAGPRAGPVHPVDLVSRQPYNVVRYISYVPHIQLEGIEHEEIHRDAN